MRRSKRERTPNHMFINDQFEIMRMLRKSSEDEKKLVFDQSKYVVIGTIEVEDDGSFRPTTIYAKRSKRTDVVIDFGKGEYEGLTKHYTFDEKMQVLRDSDGDLIETKHFKKRVKKQIKRPRDAYAFFVADRKKSKQSFTSEDFENLTKEQREEYDQKAKKDRERYVRELAAEQQQVSITNVWQLALSRIRSQLSAVRFNEMYLQSYESEGWSRSGSKSKKRKLRPEAELRRARRKIRNAKSKIRSVLRDVVTAVAGAKSEIQIPDEAYEDDFVDTEKICCAVCGSADATEGNDILLCDRAGCNKAFHQKCLNPIVTDCGDEDDDWYCHRCQCHFDGLVMINEHFDTEFEDWKDVFPECEEIVDVNSPRVSQKEKRKRKKIVLFCPKGHELKEYIAADDEKECNKCGCEIEEAEHFFTCTKCEREDDNEGYDLCDDCAHGRESRRYAGDVSRKRPPKRRAAVEALRVVTGDVGDTETKEDVEEKEEEEDSDSGSDFDTDDEDEDDEDDDDDDAILGMMNSTELDLNSPRGFGHRRRKKVDYVALAGELGLDGDVSSDDDREFTSGSRLQSHELNINLRKLVQERD